MNTNLFYPTLAHGLDVEPGKKIALRERVLKVVEQNTDVPAFSASARKLMSLVNKGDVNLEQITEIVRLDPGITAKFLKLASSPAFSGESITNIQDALMLLGLNEVRKAASAFVVINSFAHFRIKVDWELFWMHSILTARLTELLADAHRECEGKEYLAGLIHDIGKLFLEHHFAKEFEHVIFRAMATGKGMHEAESCLFDITHAEMSAILCQKWQLDKEITGAVQCHHDPSSSKDFALLATCICVADKLSNMCHANIQGIEKLDEVDITTVPEWKQLREFPARKALDLNMENELQLVQQTISSFKSPASK
jgi:HD-like signal output (HDOD) protein